MEKLYASTRKLINTEISKALSHCRARSRVYNNILLKVWKLYEEDWKRTEDPSIQPVTLVELFLFWIEGHEDIRRVHSWNVSSWMYAIGYPMLDVLMWTRSMDRCSCPSCGLLKCGCSCNASAVRRRELHICYRELKTHFSKSLEAARR